VDASGNFYVAGWTLSPSLPQMSGFQTINGGLYSAFIGKLNLSPISVSVSPSSATLSASQSQQFSATVSNAANTAVVWSVSPAGLGSITANGLYTAPVSIASSQTVTVTATSVVDSSKSGAATVSLATRNNLALGKTATQSSTLAAAGSAIDGNTNGAWSGGSISHTNLDLNAWWQVDLGASAAVDSITLWNRTDCCGFRLGKFWLFLSDTPFAAGDMPATLQSRAGTWASYQAASPNPSLTVSTGSFRGRYLRVQLATADYLSLAEVQVFGSFPQVNLAIGKAAQSSSVAFGGAASRAVDGVTDGNWAAGSVTHTNIETHAWWQVDLGAPANIGSLTIWNRTDCCGDRLSDYWVFVSNTPFTANDIPATLQSRAGIWGAHLISAPNPTSSIAVNAAGRYVRVQLSGSDYLHLAEVQVFGTPQ
jgi:hypothetical protein